jgi:tetratricopeptide (TPR) repeat protein
LIKGDTIKKLYVFYSLVLLFVACCTAREYKLSGDIFLKTGEYDKATAQYMAWAKKEKDNPSPYVALSLPYYKQDNYVKSAEYLKRAFEIDRNLAEKAVLFYEKLLEVENYSCYIFYTGAEELLNNGQIEKAIEFIEEAEEIEDSNYRAASYVLHGRIYMKEEDDDEAYRYFEKAIDFDENNAEAYLYLGEIFTNRNEFDKAVFNLKESISIKPDIFLGHKLIGQNYLKAKKYDMAVESLEKASSINSNDPIVLYSLAYAYLQKEDYTRASNVAETILNLQEAKSDIKAEAYIIMGMSDIYEEQYDEAIKVLNKAIEADSNNCDSYQLIGLAYNKAGKVKLSKEFSQKWEKCVWRSD